MEAALEPRPPGPIFLEASEGPEFDGMLAQAKAGGTRLIVVHREWSLRQEVAMDGVEHLDGVLASLEFLAGMPSNQGRRSRLGDTIHALHGNVIGPKPMKVGTA